MCDTLIALGSSTEDGSVIFGKNSDRPSNEVQLITYSPHQKYRKDELVKCTYISIPQVSETNAILLSQPWWMWGAESGSNQYGVVIGNEAVYTHEPIRNRGLLGMDLLRLGLERGKSALKALNIIADLLEKYHQGGGCAYSDPSWSYHNSFIIADNQDAYVLETADDWWIAEKVKDVRSISNGISIRGKGDLRKKGIIKYAVDKGYCKDDNDFDFATTFSGEFVSHTPSPYSRGGKSAILLNKNNGSITPTKMMSFLREHDAGICMHGGFESTGSQVSHLTRKEMCSIHWFTGTSLPCLSIYKPYNFSVADQAYVKPGPYSEIDPSWFWVKYSNYIKSISNIHLFISKIRNFENRKLHEVNKLAQNDCIKNIKMINNEMWEYTHKLVN